MATLNRTIPVLPVRHIAASASFYAEKAGFSIAYQADDYAILERDLAEVHLWAADDESWIERGDGNPVVSGAESFIAGTASCRIAVSEVDTLFQEIEPHGIVHPNGGLADKPHGLREFAILDPDNNLITFFEPIGDGG